MSAVDSPAVKAGYLQKTGGKNKKSPGHWQKRWFALRDTALSYYKSHSVCHPPAPLLSPSLCVCVSFSSFSSSFFFLLLLLLLLLLLSSSFFFFFFFFLLLSSSF